MYKYQGITLGAISTSGGQELKEAKRHPALEGIALCNRKIFFDTKLVKTNFGAQKA